MPGNCAHCSSVVGVSSSPAPYKSGCPPPQVTATHDSRVTGAPPPRTREPGTGCDWPAVQARAGGRLALTGRGREVKHVEGGNVCGVVIQPTEREQAYHPAPRRRREDAHKHLSPPSAPLQLRTNSTSPPLHLTGSQAELSDAHLCDAVPLLAAGRGVAGRGELQRGHAQVAWHAPAQREPTCRRAPLFTCAYSCSSARRAFAGAAQAPRAPIWLGARCGRVALTPSTAPPTVAAPQCSRRGQVSSASVRVVEPRLQHNAPGLQCCGQ